MRVARAIDDSASSERAAALKRLGTAVGKYYVCKRAPMVVGEALECLGGNGYVEESIMPRLYREAPLNSIWEGSGNINALDVLRIAQKQPESFEALRDEISLARDEPRIASECARMESELRGNSAAQLEAGARALAERLALLWQASLLVRYAPSAMADAFIASRLGGGSAARTLGTLAPGSAMAAIVERASPASEPVGVS
jgi:putative acyl-CoA dehydrogenase